MSKKDKVVESQVDGITPDVALEDEAAKLQAFKEKKAEAAKRWKENKAKEKAERIEKAKAFIEKAKSNGVWDKLDDSDRDFLNSLAAPAAARTAGTSSLFTTIFGANAQPGASATLEEIFNKTLKGKSNIDFYVNKWAKKGTIITFNRDESNILKSTYVVEAIGTGTDAE